MKTSKILMAMALPVAFAACTSEEIVENSNNLNMQNRKVIPAVTAVVESGVDSRFSWNEETFGWNKFTAEDKFAAGLTDAELWTVGDKMMTNYVYSLTDKGYETTSQMVEGSYFFYSYPGFEKIAARQGVPFNLTAQKSVDFKNPTAAVEANQLFISALYKLEAATANDPLPVKFVSYWSTAGLKIKNTTGEDMKVVRMMVSTSDDMPLKGIIAPSKLGTVAKDNKDITGLVYYNDGGNYVLPYKTLADGTKVREDWNDIKTMPIADTSVEGGLAEKTMMLTVDNGELADDEEATVYFQMPAGTYSSASVTLFVEVYDENEDENVVKMLEAVPFVKNLDSDKNGEADKTAFYRGGTTAVFGVEDKELAAHEVTELDILSAQESGAYAASYEDLVEIIKNGNESTISNMGELKIDNAVIKLLKSTSAKGMRPFTFVNPVEIVSTTTSAIDLKDIILVKNATITDGKFVATEDLFAPTATGDTDRNITVASGAQLTVKASQSGVITNKSTVNVEGNLLAVKIKDAADAEKNIETTVSIKGKAYVGNKAATTSQNATAPATDPTIVLDGTPTTLKLNANVVSSKKVETEMYYTQLTIGYGQTLKVDEQVKLWYWTAETDELLKNNGTIENKGTIIGVANIGTWDAVNEAAQEALIENYGIIENLQNGGTTALPAAGTADTNLYEAEALVKQMSDAADIKTVAVLEKDKTVITHLGKVDNSIGAFISVPAADAAKIYVYASYTGNYSGKLGHAQGIDKIYGTTGTWTDIELPTTAELELTGITFAETDATASSRVTTLANPVIKIVNGTSANIMKFTGASASIKLSGNYKDIEVTAATELNLNSTTKVTGTLKSATLTTLNIADTELNNVNTSALATINVRPLYGYKADGTTINAVTAKTSKLIGALTVGSNVALNLYPDVTFRAENSASITAGYKLVSAAATVEHGTITGHTCEAGKVLDYANIID